MVADQGGRTYTRIAPPSSGSVLPTSGGASQPERDVKRLRLDPGLRHLQGCGYETLLCQIIDCS